MPEVIERIFDSNLNRKNIRLVKATKIPTTKPKYQQRNNPEKLHELTETIRTDGGQPCEPPGLPILPQGHQGWPQGTLGGTQQTQETQGGPQRTQGAPWGSPSPCPPPRLD